MAFSYELSGDSYVDTAFADTYNGNQRNRSDWNDLTTDEKAAALRRATTFLDHGYDWKGDVNDTDNTHAWPRKNVDDDEGRDIDNTTIPQRIKDATAELAYIDVVESELLPVTESGETQSVKAGSVEIEYAGGQGSGTSLTRVNRLVSGLAVSATSTQAVRT
jgi:hypothetical protein